MDRHVADLATAQRARGAVYPSIIELGEKGFAPKMRAHGVPVDTVRHPYGRLVLAETASLLKRADPDVVHTHGYDSDLVGVGGWCRAGRRSRLVATVHGLSWRPVQDLAKTVASLTAVGLCADTVLVTSRKRAERIARLLPTPVRFVPNGVSISPAPAPRRSRDGDPTLLYLGRLSTEKRVDLVLATVAQVASRVPTVRLRVVGSGDRADDLRHQATRLGLASQIEFRGLVDDVAAALDEADLLLLLSDTEGTPRVLVEAMARGTPVVATDVGGIRDLIRPGVDGTLVPRRDVAAAADAVLDVLDRPEAAAALAAASRRRFLEAFTVEMMELEVARTYADVTRRARR